MIGKHLLEVIASAPASPLLFESLNTLFDVFGPDEHNGLFLQFLGPLKQSSIVSDLKKKVKGIDKRRQRDLRERGEEMVGNLQRFIGYMTEVEKTVGKIGR